MSLEFVKSNRGADMLVHDGYSFNKEKSANNKIYWKCSEYRDTKCLARCITEDDVVRKSPCEHNHVPSSPGSVQEEL